MATFNFDITSNVKKQTYVKRESNILHKDIEGVVFITENADYKVLYNDIYYNITEKSYSCKNILRVFRQGVSDKHGRPISYIRDKDTACEENKLIWTPFTAGSLVIGNIIKSTDNFILFDIKNILIDYHNEDCCKARSFYINNHKHINELMYKKMLNEFR